MARSWVHLHLPRLAGGRTPDVLSVKVTGERIDYASFVALRDCEFKVHQPGRLRCVREGVRNVHAWVVGTEELRVKGWYSCTEPPSGWRKAVYNPFLGEFFVDAESMIPVHEAKRVIMSGKNVWYLV